jgi:hypothetical protein
MRTNRYVLNRLSSFTGEIRIVNDSGAEFRIAKEFRHIMRDILREAGKDKPALCDFEVRKGVGYLMPRDAPRAGDAPVPPTP